MDLTNKTDALARLSEATSDGDWNDKVNEVKAANGGYPDWWHAEVIMSGMGARVVSAHGGHFGIKFVGWDL